MAISIDPSTHVITMPQEDLTPLGGTNYQLDTNAFRISLKNWEDSEDGIYQPKTHNHNTAITIGGVQYARLMEILSPYTITFENVGSPYRVYLIGSNNNILDKTNLNNVSVAPNNSAGLSSVNIIDFLEKVVKNKRELKKVGGVWHLLIYANDGETPILDKSLKAKEGSNIVA